MIDSMLVVMEGCGWDYCWYHLTSGALRLLLKRHGGFDKRIKGDSLSI